MIDVTEARKVWADWCAAAGVDDVYWSWEHLELWAPEWDARPLGVRWSREGEVILHPVLLVPLDRLDGGAGLRDVRTAYDFAGPLHRGTDPEGSMARFEEEWTAWLAERGVVTEFLRLHPTALPTLPSCATLHAENHVVDLRRTYEEIRRSYHGSWRRNLRKAEANDLRAEVADSPPAGVVDAFIDLYGRAMEALEADFWFHFRPETLRGLLALPRAWLVVVRTPAGEAAAMASALASGSTLFYHLGCSEPGTLGLRPNHRLFDVLIRTGRERGFHLLHLGGGSASLRRFKRHMATGTVPYHVVRRVVDPARYAELCRANAGPEDDGVFPRYVRRFAP